MRLTENDLRKLSEGEKLWLYDNRKGVGEPKRAILKRWQNKHRFQLHIFDAEGKQIDNFPWSLETNGPVGELIMPINSKVWLENRA